MASPPAHLNRSAPSLQHSKFFASCSWIIRIICGGRIPSLLAYPYILAAFRSFGFLLPSPITGLSNRMSDSPASRCASRQIQQRLWLLVPRRGFRFQPCLTSASKSSRFSSTIFSFSSTPLAFSPANLRMLCLSFALCADSGLFFPPRVILERFMSDFPITKQFPFEHNSPFCPP